MAAGAWKLFNVARQYLLDGTIDLDSHTFKMLLCTSTYAPDVEAHSLLAHITNELSGNGYARQTVAPSLSRSTVTVTFDVADAAFAASGGPITARYAVIYDDTPGAPADPLLCYSLLDTTPADVTVTDGNTLTIQINASGVFTLTGGT
jgi:hypothetical protein